jgi:hypothetical protein
LVAGFAAAAELRRREVRRQTEELARQQRAKDALGDDDDAW